MPVPSPAGPVRQPFQQSGAPGYLLFLTEQAARPVIHAGIKIRIPTATLLAVSDKPLHAQPKLSADAQDFYAASRRQHVEIAISVTEKVRQLYPGGLPAADLRSADEPLLGTTDPEPTQASSPVGQP